MFEKCVKRGVVPYKHFLKAKDLLFKSSEDNQAAFLEISHGLDAMEPTFHECPNQKEVSAKIAAVHYIFAAAGAIVETTPDEIFYYGRYVENIMEAFIVDVVSNPLETGNQIARLMHIAI